MKPSMRNIKQVSLITLILLVIFMTACRHEETPHFPETPIDSSPTFAQHPSSTSLPAHTAAPTTSATIAMEITTTNTPTPTVIPSTTSTTIWDDRGLSMTPLPLLNQPLSAESMGQLKPLAVWTAGSANDIALSPDGLTLAVGTNIGAYLYHSLNFQLIGVLQTPFSIQSITFSENNQWVALAQDGQTIDLYEREGYTLIARLSLSSWNLPPTYQVDINFSPNDTQLVSVVKTQTEIFINRWDLTSLQSIIAFKVENDKTSFINPALDLLGIITDSDLLLQSLSFPEETDSLSLPSDLPSSFWDNITSNNGEVIPSAIGNAILINNGSSITHWQITKETVTYRLDDYPLNLPSQCYDAPQTCRNIDNGFSWECEDEQKIPPIELIALTPDHIMALISLNEGQTEFRRVSDGLLAWEIDVHFIDFTLSPGSEFFFGIRTNGSIEKRSTLDGTLMDRLDQHPSRLFDLDFSPDGAVLAAGFGDGWIRVYSTYNGQMLGYLSGSAQALQFSPDGSLLAAGLTDGIVRIFILDEGRYYDLSGGHLDAVTDLTFSPDGQQLLTGSKDCTASLWDLNDRYRIQNTIPDRDHPFRINVVGYFAGLDYQVFSGDNRGITIIRDTEVQKVNFSEDEKIVTFALEPEQGMLAAVGSDTWLIPVSSYEIAPPRRLTGGLLSDGDALAFSPDGSVLIVATQQELAFWSPSDGRFLGSLEINDSMLSGTKPAVLAISPDGTLIALGAANGLINIFGIP